VIIEADKSWFCTRCRCGGGSGDVAWLEVAKETSNAHVVPVPTCGASFTMKIQLDAEYGSLPTGGKP